MTGLARWVDVHQGGEAAGGAIIIKEQRIRPRGETMLHTICLTLVLMAALAEMTALRQWHQQYVPAGIQQAAGGTDFPFIHRRVN
ncbi:MAG: hypothetical protein Q8L22_06165 [Reyranella sp.]|nr:hypothetical protein [Reyranella sp.]